MELRNKTTTIVLNNYISELVIINKHQNKMNIYLEPSVIITH